MEDFKDYIRQTYKEHRYISTTSLVGNYLNKEGVQTYRPSVETIKLRRSLACKASSVIRELVKDKKIKKYSSKQYIVL